MSGECRMCLAIPGRIVEVLPGDLPSAVVDVAGVRRRVELGLLDDATTVGDWVLIHVGFAMSKISEEDAIDQMRMLAVLGETEAALEEVRGYGTVEAETAAGGPRSATPADDRESDEVH
jgi:hydrogenase expression/formation protein HypC